ncbi:MAG TPA: hemerythrin domain-containing protein [Acidimicrobiales bacterium]
MGETAVDVLEREHHDLRALFERVRDPDADRGAAWLEIVKQVATHVAIERTFIYPVVKRRMANAPGLADDLRHDYKRMERLLVLTERRKINSPDMPDLVNDLLNVFESHQDRCTRILIPTMLETLKPVELDELGDRMRGAENVILSHPHPHLLALGPVYPMTTRVASFWDRVRDRTVQNR